MFRFSNLEILAKMEQEMATRMEKEGLNTGEGEGDENMEACNQGISIMALQLWMCLFLSGIRQWMIN